MKRRLLDILVCPRCHGPFSLTPFLEESFDLEVIEGRLSCRACGAEFPIVDTIPRLLARPLLAQLRPRHPDFFARYPSFLNGSSPLTVARAGSAETFDSFTRQRLDFSPPGPELVHQWRAHLARNLGSAVSLDALRDKLVLDAGCGFGRHLYVANEAGAETVGVDLSGGVDVARRNNRRFQRCHIVQADLLDLPFRPEAFDVVWSFGVLHHMPSPPAGFHSIVQLARRDGGLVAIWVYGYRGMALTYRLSHMRPLHHVTSGMSVRARVRASKTIAAGLSVLYLEPMKLARRVGLRRLVDRMPLAGYGEYGFSARVAAVHDRLSTPITHFHERDELVEWFRSDHLVDVCVEDTARRGWRAHAWRNGRLSDGTAAGT
jgi:SAM-dependent methyltransferase/uncharacterized protein YbaR (Trm112 family)